MDRRQRKTREAIFRAFSELLSEKNIMKITVGEIIERADVGRATFYAHFETKDILLREFSRELFCHIFDSIQSNTGHKHIFGCDSESSAPLHLFEHIKANDNNITTLLTCRNNELFISYFKSGLAELIAHSPESFAPRRQSTLPQELWVNFVCSALVESVTWWLGHGMSETPEQIYDYFTSCVTGA